MIKKIAFMRVTLSFVIALSVAMMPIRPMAAETYGIIEYWDGDWSYNIQPDLATLDLFSVSTYSYSDQNINPEHLNAIYESVGSSVLTLRDLTVGNYLNGTFQLTVNANYRSVMPDVSYGYIEVSAEPFQTDGLFVYLEHLGRSWDNHSDSFRIIVKFEGYRVNEEYLSIPINLSVKCGIVTSLPYLNQTCEILYDVVSDYSGTIMTYSDIRDLPTIDGYFANTQHSIVESTENGFSLIYETLIDKFSLLSDDIKNNFSSLILSINNRFDILISNLSNWYNGLISNLNTNFDRLLNQNNEEHEETLNGYQGTGTPEASEKFDQSAGELESIESDLTGITNSSIGSYTDTAFDTTVITSLGSSLVYVVTWFTNFWNMGGLFTSILNVGLALSVAFFILRLRGAD